MTPLERYQQDLAQGRLSPDSAQAEAVGHIQRLYEALTNASDLPRDRRFLGWLSRRPGIPLPIKGLYLWGGVGRGKTYLMDALFACLPFEEKLRIHFHRFMHTLHQKLRTLKHKTDPLQWATDRFARRARVICFDEFHVSDITDAMLLGKLLKALFDRG